MSRKRSSSLSGLQLKASPVSTASISTQLKLPASSASNQLKRSTSLSGLQLNRVPAPAPAPAPAPRPAPTIDPTMIKNIGILDSIANKHPGYKFNTTKKQNPLNKNKNTICRRINNIKKKHKVYSYPSQFPKLTRDTKMTFKGGKTKRKRTKRKSRKR